MDKLDCIFELQKEFGSKFNDFDVIRKSDEIRQIKTMEFIGHVMEELIELRRELPIRKDWSRKMLDTPIWENVLSEFVDALHFLVTIALINGWTSEDVYTAYTKKNNINLDRLKGGY